MSEIKTLKQTLINTWGDYDSMFADKELEHYTEEGWHIHNVTQYTEDDPVFKKKVQVRTVLLERAS